MSDYFAPLEEMRFTINELAGLDEILALPGHEEFSPDLVDSILEEAGKLANEVLAPLNAVGDTQGNKFAEGVVTTAPGFKEAYAQFAEGGWCGLSADPEYDGQGLPEVVSTPVIEMWKASNMAFALCPMLTTGALHALEDHCDDEALKALYLPKMVSGEWAGTMDLTEPQAGSDLSAVRTKAVPEGDHYRLYGQKIFITWGEQDFTDNIIHLVLGRTPDAPEGTKGISMFIVPNFLVNEDGSLGKRNDVHCVSIEHKMGIVASPTATLAYGDNEGAVGYLIGKENRGLEYMFTMMNHARLAVGLEGVAISERAYQAALAYAKERIQGFEIGVKGGERVPIIKHPDVRRMLMFMKTYIEAMRALCYVAAGYMDRAKREPDAAKRQHSQALLDALIPVVKGWCSEMGVHVTSTGVQIHGGMGYIEESGAPQHMRDAQIATIYEGTTGIQALDLVGRKVAMDKGVAAQTLVKEIRGVVEELAAIPENDHCVAMHKTLKTGVKALSDAINWVLLAFGSGNFKFGAASSVPFLHLMGTVAGGWLMARSALIAEKKLKAGDSNRAFYEAKLVTARFYADYILSQAPALAHSIMHGAGSVMALSEDQF